MKTFKQTYEIRAGVEKVWQALVDPKIIEKWSGSSAKMDGKVGTKFELWGGDIWGINTEVVESKKLVQDWFGGDWREPSKVTFVLTSDPDGTRVDLIHENLPDEEAGEFEDGWRKFYMGEIKRLLEKAY
ncbi:MAG: SRPBCC domain-containing protein [Candidatus Woykebacteria bacterium]